jgi:hypothetical protein
MFNKNDEVKLTRGSDILYGKIMGLAAPGDDSDDPVYYVMVRTAIDTENQKLSIAILKYKASEITRV